LEDVSDDKQQDSQTGQQVESSEKKQPIVKAPPVSIVDKNKRPKIPAFKPKEVKSTKPSTKPDTKRSLPATFKASPKSRSPSPSPPPASKPKRMAPEFKPNAKK